MEISGNMLPLFFPMALYLVMFVAGLLEIMVFLNSTSLAENTTQQMPPITETSEPFRMVRKNPKLKSITGDTSIQNLAAMLCAYCQRTKLLTECEALCQYNALKFF
ncbi:hypothetical protein ACJMK2_009331 [Sinanodonta woodiana]|uniref:Uncharacterized protein n=1 Tax=Sinanodonta woodiana TaxID=1069815 RepID=A0ABD3VDL6_SINWO